MIGAGITVHEALAAAEILETQHNIKCRVMDPFTLKPIDKAAIIASALECNGKIVVSEDHYPEGFLFIFKSFSLPLSFKE